MTVPSIIATALVTAVAPGAAVVSSPGAPQAAARFAELMKLPPDDLVPAAAPAAVPGASGTTLGDAILNRMAAVGEGYRTSKLALEASLEAGLGELSVIDVLRVQMSMLDKSLGVDLISKGVARFTEHSKTLTQLQ